MSVINKFNSNMNNDSLSFIIRSTKSSGLLLGESLKSIIKRLNDIK